MPHDLDPIITPTGGLTALRALPPNATQGATPEQIDRARDRIRAELVSE